MSPHGPVFQAHCLLVCLVLAAMSGSSASSATSFYTRHLEDAAAVCAPEPGGADDTAALQGAIDRVQETTGQGIVLLRAGRYWVTQTLYVWPGIRLIGMGATRPVLCLPAGTPGFEDPAREKVLLFFAGGRPGYGRGRPAQPAGVAPRTIPDANPGTFYSAASNFDVEIESGNPGAVAVRARYAQHCFLAHMEFRLGSALAGIHEAGNVVEDVRFVGGQHAVWTSKPSPSWQFFMIDCTFEDQQTSAIREHEAGLTLIRPAFRRTPVAVEVEAGWHDELWIQDALFEDIRGSALAFGLERNPRNEINVERAQCRNVPVFAALRESGRRFAAPTPGYAVEVFSHGLHFRTPQEPPSIRTIFETAALAGAPSLPSSDRLDPPDPATWVNVRELGAAGDGVTDDTACLRQAIARHRALYFPSGYYVVRDTLLLRPDTVLLGLHPGATQVILPDGTAGFAGVGGPRALLEAPPGGSNIVMGLGLYTQGNNPRAVAALWKAGSHSFMNDVRFLGGHGTPKPDGSRENPYNPNHTADPDPARRWDSQYPSLWITEGGGGTFLDLWTPSTFATAGLRVSDTETAGRVYAVSSEHHVRSEVQVQRAAHWSFHALQTEAERGESGACLPVEVQDSRDILFANTHLYRVISSFQPYPCAVRVTGSSGIRFRNLHCYSNSKVGYDAAVIDITRGREIREREWAWLDLDGPPRASRLRQSAWVARGARVVRLAAGFHNISGGAAGPGDDFYFIDPTPQRIHRWDHQARQLSTLDDTPFNPVNLAVDSTGNLLVISSSGQGTVYTLDGLRRPAVRHSETSAPAGPVRFHLPVSDWRLNRESLGRPVAWFRSADQRHVIPVGQDFLDGATSWGVKSSPPVRSFALAPAGAGQTFYVSDEAQLTTWAATVQPDGALRGFRVFAEQGGEGCAVDARGNVYLAAGNIHVFSPDGRPLGSIEVPERPTQVAFGGRDGRTLFITARTSLYSVRTRYPGR